MLAGGNDTRPDSAHFRINTPTPLSLSLSKAARDPRGLPLLGRAEGEVGIALLLAGIAVVSVVASWALIQTDYMLRMAHVYYADPEGGIDFNQDEDPMFTDFAYIAVGLGMTYQISDTDLRTNALRRIVIAQTLLAYVFGAVILATVVNLVAGLGG